MVVFFVWLGTRPAPVGEGSWLMEKYPLDSRKGSWGVNLEPAVVALEEIVNLVMPYEGIHALTDPPLGTAEAVEAVARSYLTTATLVAGVAIGGEAHAYPLSLLLSHEVINTTVGGEPVALTYSPLADSLVAFSRRVGGEARAFGATGLAYRSHALVVDRRVDPHESSLWSPLQMRAVTGPAAGRGETLEWVDVELAQWEAWEAAHPETLVASPRTGYDGRYSEFQYRGYFSHDRLYYPEVRRTGRRPELRDKDRVIVVQAGAGEARVYPLIDLVGGAGAGASVDAGDGDEEETRDGAWRWYEAGDGVRLGLAVEAAGDEMGALDPGARAVRVRVEPEGTPVRRLYGFWHAVDAARGEWEVTGGERGIRGLSP